MTPTGFSHTLYQTSQISKNCLFDVINTVYILIGAPPENFCADALGGSLNQKLKFFCMKTVSFEQAVEQTDATQVCLLTRTIGLKVEKPIFYGGVVFL